MTNWHDPILTEAQAKALLAQPGHILLEHNGSHLLARIISGTPADILTLYTPEQSRRQGHARTLLNQLVAEATKANCPAITLEVRASNTAAISLYESVNFTHTATRKAYYTNPAEDALILTRSLL
jgi:ribosomal protein S18 acetylase RimI-like enzyme